MKIEIMVFDGYGQVQINLSRENVFYLLAKNVIFTDRKQLFSEALL